MVFKKDKRLYPFFELFNADSEFLSQMILFNVKTSGKESLILQIFLKKLAMLKYNFKQINIIGAKRIILSVFAFLLKIDKH